MWFHALVVLALLHGSAGHGKHKPNDPLGAPCASDAECVSGYCVDGLCCDTSCGDGNPNDCLVCSDGVCTLMDGQVCRPAGGGCDVEEVCDGVEPTCPEDAVASAGEVCLPASGPCDVDDTCDGTHGDCPEDVLAADGTRCSGSDGRIGHCAEGNCDIIPVDPIDETIGEGVDAGCSTTGGGEGAAWFVLLGSLAIGLRRRSRP